MKRFDGKTVVVTGGNKGIGYAVAERFAAEGANLVLASVEAQVTEAAAALCEGGASAIPCKDASLDGAAVLQVLEYVDDIAGACAELARVLRPGGRVVVGDMQHETLSWASDDPDRMKRMTKAWERHVAEPNAPARLPHLLTTAGLKVLEMPPIPFTA